MSIDYRDHGTLKVGGSTFSPRLLYLLSLEVCFNAQLASGRFFHAYPCSADSLVRSPGIETFSSVSIENNEISAT